MVKNGERRSPRLRAKNAKTGRNKSFKGCIIHAAIEGKGRLAARRIKSKGIGLIVIGSVPIKKNEVIAIGEGTVIGVGEINTDINKNKYKLYINSTSYLLLHDPRPGFLANLVNTAGDRKTNNATITYNKYNNSFTVRAIRNIQPGEEVTAAYGNKFTRFLNIQTPLPNINIHNFLKETNRKGYYTCSLCKYRGSFTKCNSHYNLHLKNK